MSARVQVTDRDAVQTMQRWYRLNSQRSLGDSDGGAEIRLLGCYPMGSVVCD